MSCPDSFSRTSDDDAAPLGVAAEHFARAIEQSDHRSQASTAELREAACQYVRELKAQQLPPEQVLVSVKRLITSVRGRPEDEDDDARRRLLQQVITWCIDAYYSSEG